jgi:hypothetical protein
MRAAVAGVVLAVACGRGVPSNSDVAVRPSDSPPGAAPASAIVRVFVRGPGSVRAAELSLDCRQSCDATVQPGSLLGLAAVPDPTATFQAWHGACSGASACDLAVTRDVVVIAEFRPEDPCAGIAPSEMGAPVTAALPDPGERRYCEGATSDGQGNVGHLVDGMGVPVWQLYAPDGTATARIPASYLVPEETGFHGGYGSQSPDPTMNVWNGKGTLLAAHPVGPSPSWFFPARTGGSVVVSTDSWNCPNGPRGHATMNVWRFDETGNLVSVVDIGGVGCPVGESDGVVALSDELDNTFVAILVDGGGGFGFPEHRVLARWISREGAPLTPWMDVAPWAQLPQVAPIIGGGVVLRAGDSSAFFASGSSTPSPPPDFIPKYHDVSIVRGGTAYAVVPRFGWARDHAIELYASDGTHCATLDFSERTGLYIGADGTVIATDPHDLCKASWWPHLLR